VILSDEMQQKCKNSQKNRNFATFYHLISLKYIK